MDLKSTENDFNFLYGDFISLLRPSFIFKFNFEVFYIMVGNVPIYFFSKSNVIKAYIDLCLSVEEQFFILVLFVLKHMLRDMIYNVL